MRRLAVVMALAGTALAGPALARDKAWYAGIEGGALLIENIDFDVTSPQGVETNNGVTVKHKMGYDVDGIVGYDFGGFRTEFELGFKKASLDKVTLSGVGVPGSGQATTGTFSDAGGTTSVLSFMLNGLLDFGDDDGWNGYVGGGVGIARVKAGLHYIAINLAASLLFLIGVSLIYGVTGTLNMADLAVRIPQVAAQDRMLLEAGAAVLGIAFLTKAAMWPLGLWLPTTYAAAAPPVAAMLAIMSKVGVYVVLRLSLLLFGEGSGASARFGESWLLAGGMMTLAFGAIGVLASQTMARLAGFAVLVSSGTLLAVIGTGQAGATGPALFYLVSSTLAASAFFMLIELVERGRDPGADMLAVTAEAYGEDGEEAADEPEAVGIAIPATMALLSLSFLGCALLLAGLPPLSGFIAKFAMLTALLNPSGAGGGEAVPAASWALLALLILSGLTTLIAMTRAGIRAFWGPVERAVPRVRVIEIAPVAAFLLACAALTVKAEPAMRYMQEAASALHEPGDYIGSVLTAPRAPGPRGEGAP